MLAGIARSVVSKVPKTMTRNVNVVTGPALVHISTMEKAVLAGVMITCWLATPAWVLVNIKNYRGKAE